MSAARVRILAFAVAALLASCHLIGGTDGLVIIEGSDESNATVGSTSVSSSVTTGGGGAPSECTAEVCTMHATECETCACVEGVVCVCTPLAFGQGCSLGYCDSDGSCVECLDDDNYPCMDMSLNCELKTCVTASCSDGEPNGDETDLDCGGSCAPCANGQICDNHDDCASALCSAQLLCAPCSMHSDCGQGRYCEGSVCHPQGGIFDQCSQHYHCLSNNCVCIIGCGCGP